MENYPHPWRSVIKDSNDAICQYLNNNTIDVNKSVVIENDLNILHIAVSEKKYQVLNTILSFQPQINVNGLDLFGKTALHYACANGDEQACTDLIESGANINIASIGGETPFMKACYFVEKDLIQFMLEHRYFKNLDVNCVDSFGRNALTIQQNNLRFDIQLNDEKLQRIIKLILQKMNNNGDGTDQNEEQQNNNGSDMDQE